MAAHCSHLNLVRTDLPRTQGCEQCLAIDAGGSQTDREPVAWVLVQAAMLFWHRGDYEGADAGFKQAFELVRGYPPALVGRGRVAMACQEFRAALHLSQPG